MGGRSYRHPGHPLLELVLLLGLLELRSSRGGGGGGGRFSCFGFSSKIHAKSPSTVGNSSSMPSGGPRFSLMAMFRASLMSRNFRSRSSSVVVVIEGEALTSKSHGLKSLSIRTSKPYISKLCLSFTMTFWTAFNEWTMICSISDASLSLAALPRVLSMKSIRSLIAHFPPCCSL